MPGSFPVSAPLKIGVVGLGFGRQVHVPALRTDPRCQVVAIAGRSMEKAKQAARELAIEAAYGDWRALLDDASIDAVTIAVPPSEQPAIACAALSAGKHVLCEKPLAASANDAQNTYDAAVSAGKVHAVDFIFPELPLWIKARELLQSGAVGEVRHVVVDWRVETYAAKTKARSWKNDASQGGGVLNNFLSHVVHNVEWFFGNIGELEASVRGPSRGAETCVHATCDMAAGFPVFLSVASDAFLGHGHRITVHGEDGTLVLDNPTTDYASGFELSLGTRGSGALDLIQRDEPRAGIDGRVAPVARIASRFLEAIVDGTSMAPNFYHGLRAQLFLEQMRAPASLGHVPERVPALL